MKAEQTVGRIGYSLAEFAEMTGRTPAAIHQAARVRGSIPSVRVGGRVMIPAAYIDALREGREWTPPVDASLEVAE